MEWISENREWLFSGLGASVVLGVISFVFKRKTNEKGSKQSIKAGKNSTNIQAGKDANVTFGDKNDRG